MLMPNSSTATKVMPMPAELIAVVGATGQVGRRLVAELVERGHPVRAVSRQPAAGPDVAVPGSEVVAADLADPAAATAATAGCAVIFHVAGAPYADWPQALPAAMRGAITAARAHDATLVYLDNLYPYGAPSAPLTPATPYRPVGALGRVRAEIADELEAAGLRHVIVRVSDFYGAGPVRSSVGALVLDPIAAGRRARWPIDLDQPHSLHYLPDVARGLAVVGTAAEAVGHTWHLPAAEALTGADFGRAVARAYGAPERVGLLGLGALRFAAPFSRAARDLASLRYQYDRPYVVDGTATTAAFGLAPTPHAEALARIVAAGA
jgi:nucleoside-diphosphate-sugar epimerase